MDCSAQGRAVFLVAVFCLISLQSFASSLLKLDQGMIVQVDTATGAIEKEYPPENYPYISLTTHQNFAYAGIERGIIYKIDLDSGKIVGSIIAPLAGFSQLATDGTSLWIATGGSIYQLRLSDAMKLSQFSAPDNDCKGLVVEGDFLLYTAGDGEVHKISIQQTESNVEAGVFSPASSSPAPGGPTP